MTYDVGVVVGRFQINTPHKGHLEVLEQVHQAHKQMIIVLGVSKAKVSFNNPLDFESRKRMLQACYPKATITFIEDTSSDKVWSNDLDKIVDNLTTVAQKTRLYGGRESFIKSYVGKYPTAALEPTTYVSASRIRENLAKSIDGSPEFRAGVIWASQNRYPAVMPTVDVAVLRDEEILLVKKPLEDKWRLPGGFVSPTDATFEAAARREVAEELGIEITDPRYVATVVIDDWRYRNEPDKIITTLFKSQYMFGAVRPGDDVAFAQWFPLNADTWAILVPEHRTLYDRIRTDK